MSRVCRSRSMAVDLTCRKSRNRYSRSLIMGGAVTLRMLCTHVGDVEMFMAAATAQLVSSRIATKETRDYNN